MADSNEQQPIIKKVIKVEGGGHHGGAWKVAYADFVTAMMAFFMLLWLLNVAPPETLAGLADYFSPTTTAVSGHTGSEAINPPSEKTVGANPSPAQIITKPGPPKSGPDSGEKTGADGPDRFTAGRNSLEERMKALEDEAFKDIEDDLRLAIQESPILNQHSDQLLFEITEDGLKIQIIDKDRRAMFRTGSDELYQYAELMIQAISSSIQELPNRVSLFGHTDGGVFIGPGGTGNWELSSSRANTARRVMERNGLADDRILEIIGKAGTDPLYPDQPSRTENRRITILLVREAPVVPPSLVPSR